MQSSGTRDLGDVLCVVVLEHLGGQMSTHRPQSRQPGSSICTMGMAISSRCGTQAPFWFTLMSMGIWPTRWVEQDRQGS